MRLLVESYPFSPAVGMELSLIEEQRINIKFLAKLGKNGREIFECLKQVYGDNSLKEPTVNKWLKRFREGREEVKDDPRPGRPSTSSSDENVERIRACVLKDRRLTVRMIADELSIPKTIVHEILTQNLEMKKLCAKIVPKLLTPEQKAKRVECCEDWLEAEERGDFLNRVITGDESWFYEFDVELKSQSKEWKLAGEPRTKKSRKSRSNVKTMLIVFFDSRGIVHKEFVPPGQRVNGNFYVEVLTRLRARVARVRPDLAQGGRWILHHDNAPAHTSLVVREFLARSSITVTDHPPYSPDLAPCDFFLFPKCKMVLRGRHLGDVEAIKAETTRQLNSITTEDFQQCYQQWKRRWQKCISSQGEYFEGDHIVIPE